MSDYNQEDQGQQDPQGHQPAPQGVGQNPPPKPGQQQGLPDQGNLKSRAPDQRKQDEVTGKDEVAGGGEKGSKP